MQQGTGLEPWAGQAAPIIFPPGVLDPGIVPLGALQGTSQGHAGGGGGTAWGAWAGTGGGPRRKEGGTFVPAKVFLGGISNDTNVDSLQAYCGQWGEIADMHVMSGKGYAFVTFAAVPTAQAFLEHREHYIDGRKVDAKAAVPKDQGGGKLTRKMFVGGIGEVSDAEFYTHFANFGAVVDCVVLRKPDGSSRGFGFVTYEDEVSVEKCLVMEHHLAGRRVDVKRAVGKEHDGGGGSSAVAAGGGGMGAGQRAGGGAMGGMQQMGSGDGGRGRDGGSQDKTQDWTCTECGNTNYSWRHTCNRCKTRRSHAPFGAAGSGGSVSGAAADIAGLGMGIGMAGSGGLFNPAMVLPAGLVAGMLQNAGMQGMVSMNPMQLQNLNLAAMGGMAMPAGMGGMPMGTMAGMPAMMGLGGMEAGMSAAAGGGLPGGMPGGAMGTLGVQGYALNPMVGMASGIGNFAGMAGMGAVGMGSGAGGFGGTSAGDGSGSDGGGFNGAGAGGGGSSEGSGGYYGRMPGGRRGSGGGAQQRYRPY